MITPVPSLYVRVYQAARDKHFSEERSLIICEGISDYKPNHIAVVLFPHYM